MKVLFLTHRAQVHQARSLAAAPDGVLVQILRDASRAEILAALPGVEVLITEREDALDAGIFASGAQLRLVQRLGGQVDDIDLQSAKAAGVAVCRWPDETCSNVAEHCLMQILNLLKKTRELNARMSAAAWTRPSRRSDEDTFAYNWTEMRGIESLRGQTVGILGLGEIGRELAARLAGFDCKVLYHKRSRLSPVAEARLELTYASQDDLVRASSVLVDLLPYSAAGDQAINAAFFARMPRGAHFVFCGGSGGVDEAALLDALRAGQIGGAALDTYTAEPLPASSPLLKALRESPALNLILTPHIAAGTIDFNREWDSAHIYGNLIRLQAGQPLLYRMV